MHVWAKRFHFAVKLRYICGETYWTLSTSLLCRKAALCAGSSHLAKVEQIVSSFLLAMWLGRSAHMVGGRETWLGLGDPRKEHVSRTCFCYDRAVSSLPYFSITSQIYSGFSVSFFFLAFFFPFFPPDFLAVCLKRTELEWKPLIIFMAALSEGPNMMGSPGWALYTLKQREACCPEELLI